MRFCLKMTVDYSWVVVVCGCVVGWFVSLVLLFVCVVRRTSVRVWCACAWRACAWRVRGVVVLVDVWCVSLFGVCRCVFGVCVVCGWYARACVPCECAWAFVDVFPGYVGCVLV